MSEEDAHIHALAAAQKYNSTTVFTDPLVIYIDGFLSLAEVDQLLNDRYSESSLCKFIFRQDSNEGGLRLNDGNIADLEVLVLPCSSPLESSLKTLTAHNIGRPLHAPFLPNTYSLRSSLRVRSHSWALSQESPPLSPRDLYPIMVSNLSNLSNMPLRNITITMLTGLIH